jgi:hypothetical protein
MAESAEDAHIERLVAHVAQEVAGLPDSRHRDVEAALAAVFPSRPPLGGDKLYRLFGSRARAWKVGAQMSVAVLTVLFLVLSLVLVLVGHPSALSTSTGEVTRKVLEVVGLGLAVATAIELVYALFTDGPDEIIDPIMLGLVSAMLVQLANTTELAVGQAVAALLYALALGVLFKVRERFVRVKEAQLRREPEGQT